MNRPTLEVADIIRASGDSYWEQAQITFGLAAS